MIESLENEVIKWAEEKGIFEGATPITQFSKTLEETTELMTALIEHNLSDTEDAIGDILVTLIIQAHMHGLSLSSCLSRAYNEIKDRKGQMINGVFVKA
jgi:NTP pyrophosphatase (non-canonical NTP hydrolase)